MDALNLVGFAIAALMALPFLVAGIAMPLADDQDNERNHI